MPEHLARRPILLLAVACWACAARSPASGTQCPGASADAVERTPAPAEPSAAAPGAAPTVAAPPIESAVPERAPSPRDATAFGTWLARHEHARDLPLLVAHAFAGAEARNVTVSVSYASGESAVRATATVTLDGLLDDSVRGEEHVLTFARDAVGAPWRLEQTTSRVRCWQGRGHAELSAAPCI
jgi:hypothetical protein